MEINGEVAQGKNPIAEKKRRKLQSSLTLGEAFEEYIRRRDLKPQTIFDIRRCLKETFGDWRDKPLSSITPDMVLARHQRYGQEHSQARANLAMRYLRAVFNLMMELYPELELTNPICRLSRTKSWFRIERRQGMVPIPRLGEFVSYVHSLPNPHHRDYLMFVLLTGARRSEALNLTWRDVDLRAGLVTFPNPKNRKDHVLPLCTYLMQVLRQRRLDRGIFPYVFTDDQGRRIGNLRYTLAQIEKALGFRVTIHDLRRTFATVAANLTTGYLLKRLLNHATGQDVTAGYVVTDPEELRKPMEDISWFVLGELCPSRTKTLET